ncbi:MAG: acyl-CoA reductase, partial [Candidatus Binatia bacterium]
DIAVLARIADGPRSCVALLGIVAAGNIPGVALAKASLALAAGAPCIVKSASGEPLLAVLFAEALAGADPSLASALAVTWWEGGSAPCEEEFLRGIDSLIAYGSDGAIESLAARGPKRFVGHRHKLSIGLVRLDGEHDLAEIAEAAAMDVAFYDQLGCLSPQSLFTVAGTPGERGQFIEALWRALAAAERRWPPGFLPEAQALAIRRLRDEYEWRGIRGEAVAVYGGAGAGSWTIVDDPTPGLRPSPLHRTIFVRHLESLADLRSALGEWLPRIESVGMAPWPDEGSLRAVSALGVPRLAPLGAMQIPDLAWRQGGLEPMAGIRAEGIA